MTFIVVTTFSDDMSHGLTAFAATRKLTLSTDVIYINKVFDFETPG
jgi:hypothetical protein